MQIANCAPEEELYINTHTQRERVTHVYTLVYRATGGENNIRGVSSREHKKLSLIMHLHSTIPWRLLERAMCKQWHHLSSIFRYIIRRILTKHRIQELSREKKGSPHVHSFVRPVCHLLLLALKSKQGLCLFNAYCWREACSHSYLCAVLLY